MKRPGWAIATVLIFLASLSACSGSGNGTDDAGTDAGPDAGTDGGADAGADENLGDAYGLRVPEGMQACSSGAIFADDLAATFEMTGRVTFKPGLHRLYKDRDSFEVDLVEKVEWNKEPQEGAPAGPGLFVREGTLYSFSQDFVFGQRTMQFSLRVSYESGGEIVDLNDRGLLDWLLQANGEVGVASLYFMPCSYDLYNHGVYAYTLEGGDLLTIEACDYCQMICKSSQGGIQKAEVVLNGNTRTLEDPMQLLLQFGQHDWYGTALVYLREPLGGVAALVLDFGALPELPGSTVQFFDGDFQLVETRNVTATERRQEW